MLGKNFDEVNDWVLGLNLLMLLDEAEETGTVWGERICGGVWEGGADGRKGAAGGGEGELKERLRERLLAVVFGKGGGGGAIEAGSGMRGLSRVNKEGFVCWIKEGWEVWPLSCRSLLEAEEEEVGERLRVWWSGLDKGGLCGRLGSKVTDCWLFEEKEPLDSGNKEGFRERLLSKFFSAVRVLCVVLYEEVFNGKLEEDETDAKLSAPLEFETSNCDGWKTADGGRGAARLFPLGLKELYWESNDGNEEINPLGLSLFPDSAIDCGLSGLLCVVFNVEVDEAEERRLLKSWFVALE